MSSLQNGLKIIKQTMKWTFIKVTYLILVEAATDIVSMTHDCCKFMLFILKWIQ